MSASAESTKSIEEVFRTQMAAYATCDVDLLMTTFAENCVLRDMADPDAAFVGLPQVREFLAGYFSDLANVQVTIFSIIANERDVIGELDVTADWISAPFSPSEPRSIRLRYAVIDTIENGLVVYERFYWDSENLKKQLEVANVAQSE